MYTRRARKITSEQESLSPIARRMWQDVSVSKQFPGSIRPFATLERESGEKKGDAKLRGIN